MKLLEKTLGTANQTKMNQSVMKLLIVLTSLSLFGCSSDTQTETTKNDAPPPGVPDVVATTPPSPTLTLPVPPKKPVPKPVPKPVVNVTKTEKVRGGTNTEISKPIPNPPVTVQQTPPAPIITQPTLPRSPEPPQESEVPYSQIDQVRLKEQNVYYLKSADKPFTGKAYKEFPSGTHSFEIECVNGKTQGMLTQYYSSGKKRFQVPMRDNQANGDAVGWYTSGEKKSEYPYQKGVVNGTFTEWFKTGQQSLQANYIEGRLRGKIQGWYLDGTPYLIGEIKGDESTRVSVWYEHGSKWKEIGWREGKLWGYYMEWSRDGDLVSVKSYKNGKLLKVIK
jgi:antitoxin component YwqK of YwqJK toxin-antitoxin module